MCSPDGLAPPRVDPGDERTRLVLIEDHDMVATAFGAILGVETDLELVATATTISEGEEAIRRHRPDVVLTDLRLPDGLATDRMASLRVQWADRCPAVLIVTGAPTDKAVVDALGAGARGFLSKTRPMQELTDAIRKVARGETVVDPELVHVLVGQLDHGHRATLTPREVDVLQQLADGRDTSTIAGALHLSPNTIRNHVSRILMKLGAHSRLEAVSEATRRGMISAPTPF